MKKIILLVICALFLISCDQTETKVSVKASYDQDEREIIIEIENEGEKSIWYKADEVFLCQVTNKKSNAEYTWNSDEDESYELQVGEIYKVKLRESLPVGVYEMSVITQTKKNIQVKHLSTIEVK